MAQHAHALSDQPGETPEQREARLTWERARLAEGEASVAAGDVIRDEDLDAWLDALVSGDVAR